jgi:hypothetical protein
VEHTALHRSLDHNREHLSALWARSLELESRSAGWVLAGNAAALLLCFNAVAAGSVSSVGEIQLLGIAFLFGMNAAFASILYQKDGYGMLASAISSFVAKGTEVLTVVERLRSEEVTGHAERDRVSQDLHAEIHRLKAQLDQIDIVPAAAMEQLRRARWALVSACMMLGGGAAIALWRLPAVAG